MKHLAAYLLLTLAGKEAPSADDVSAVLAAAGIEGDAERLEKLVGDLNGKDINKVCCGPAVAGQGEGQPGTRPGHGQHSTRGSALLWTKLITRCVSDACYTS